MQLKQHNTESCTLHGLILTCFVNGRKRFRALPLQSINPQPASPAAQIPATQTPVADKTLPQAESNLRPRGNC